MRSDNHKMERVCLKGEKLVGRSKLHAIIIISPLLQRAQLERKEEEEYVVPCVFKIAKMIVLFAQN